MNIRDIISFIVGIIITFILLYILAKGLSKFKLSIKDEGKKYRCEIRIKTLTGDEREITLFTDVKRDNIEGVVMYSRSLEYDRKWLTYKDDDESFQVRTDQIASIDIRYEENMEKEKAICKR